jgi:hypothetical protein
VGVTETDSGAETGIKEDGASDARPMRKPTLSSLSSDIGESRVDKSSLQTKLKEINPLIDRSNERCGKRRIRDDSNSASNVHYVVAHLQVSLLKCVTLKGHHANERLEEYCLFSKVDTLNKCRQAGLHLISLKDEPPSSYMIGLKYLDHLDYSTMIGCTKVVGCTSNQVLGRSPI